MKLTRVAMVCALVFGTGGFAGSVFAQSPDELKRQIEELQRQLKAERACCKSKCVVDVRAQR